MLISLHTTHCNLLDVISEKKITFLIDVISFIFPSNSTGQDEIRLSSKFYEIAWISSYVYITAATVISKIQLL